MWAAMTPASAGKQAAGRRSRWLGLGLGLATGVLLLTRLGAVDLWAPDEPRYAEVAEEVRSFEHGAPGLVLLHLNGTPYTQKPPLYFWLAALGGAPGGRVDEVAARLPSALAAVGLVGLTVLLGRRLFGMRAGLLAGALLLTCYEFAHVARRAQLDLLLALLETLALVAFWRIDTGSGNRRWLLAGMHAAMGLAVLTKGPVGVLVPLLVMASYLAAERRLREIGSLLPPWALALSLGPGLAWVSAAVALAPDGYLGEAVGENLFGRFFAGTSHARPIYYYLFQLPLDFLPWTFLWPAVYWTARHHVFPGAGSKAVHGDGEARAREWRFLLAWVGASLVFFTLSSGKRGLYLVPAFPALALLCAEGTRWAFHLNPVARTWLRRAGAFWALLLAGVGVTALLAPLFPRQGIDARFLVAFGTATLGILLVSAATLRRLRRTSTGPGPLVGVALATLLGIETALFQLLYPGFDPGKSPRPIAERAAALTAPGDRIGLFGNRAMAGGLAYYAHRRVALLSGAESIEQFTWEGGRVIVVQERKLDRVRTGFPLEIRGRFRDGRRTVVVVTPAEAGDQESAP